MMLRSGSQACTASRSTVACSKVHAAARPVHSPSKLHHQQRDRRITVCAAAAGAGVTTVAVRSPEPPALAERVQQLWDQLQPKIAAPGPLIWYHERQPELRQLEVLDEKQPHLLAWHMLHRLRPFLEDVEGRVSMNYMASVIAHRATYHMDYSPLVWALGLEQTVAPATSSPLPPPLHPPLPPPCKDLLLQRTLQIMGTMRSWSFATRSQQLRCIQQVLEQLQQQQAHTKVLGSVEIPLRLWWLCGDAEQPEAFWQLLRDVPELHWAVAYMPRELEVEDVQPVADGFMQLGLLAGWDPEDVWWLVCRLDNAVGDRDRVLQVFGTLALQAPHHPSLDCLGPLLLQLASNARRRRKLSYPRGKFGEPDPDESPEWETSDCSFMANQVVTEYIPELACCMAAPEVIDWVNRLQLVLPPTQTYRLLLQLLQGRNSRKLFQVKGILQLYDLLLQQVARPGWEAQQQAAMLPPGAADVVLGSLRDASKYRAAAAKVLVVWRHMAGTLDPTWCGGGLAEAAKAAGKAVKQAHLAPSLHQEPLVPSLVSAASSVRHQQLQRLSAKGQQQVLGALQQLGLQAELVEVGGAAAM